MNTSLPHDSSHEEEQTLAPAEAARRMEALERSNATQEARAAENAMEEYSILRLQGIEPNYDYDFDAVEYDEDSLNRNPYTSLEEGEGFYYPYINIDEDYISYDHVAEMPKIKTPGIIRVSDVEEEPIDWLWEPFIPRGSVTIIVGEGGIGKSTVALSIMTNISNGTAGFPLGNVLYFTTEDSVSRTTRPKLKKMGANDKRILTDQIDNRMTTLDDPRFLAAIEEHRPVAVIISPIKSYFGDASIYHGPSVRKVMDRLGDIAEKYNCAIILIAHPSGSRTKGVLSVEGSGEFVTSARTVLRPGANPNDPDDRAINIAKANLTKTGISYGYTVNADGEFVWTGPSELTLVDMDTAPKQVKGGAKTPPRARDEVLEFVETTLAGGPVLSTTFEEMAKEQDISKRALGYAEKELGVIRYKSKEFQGKYLCRLPGADD